MLLAGCPARLLLRAAGMPHPIWHVLMCAVLTVTIDAPHPSAPRLAWLGWAGDPVNTVTGMFVYTRLDLAMRTPQGAVLAFTRAHSSFDTRVTALGPGWNLSYNQHLAPFDASRPNDEALVEPDGRTDQYRFKGVNPDGTWTYLTPPGLHDTLVRNADATYTSMRADKSRWDFDTAGLLERIVDPQGHETVLRYSTTAWPSDIGDPSGPGSLHLEYGSCAPNRLCSISDWLSPPRVTRFEYDNLGRLWRVTDREGSVTTYGYDGDTQRLASITDALGHVALTNHYDAQGRAIEQFDARGRTTSFSYAGTTGAGQHTARSTVIAHAASGFAPESPTTVRDTYDDLGRFVRRETLSAPNDAAFVEERAYNDNWDLVGCTRHGGETPQPAGEPAADDAVPLLPPIAAAPGPESQTCTGPGYPIPDWRAATDPRRMLFELVGTALMGATDVRFDAAGRLESVAAADDGSDLSAAERTWRFAYDREDRLIRVEQPNALAQLSALVTQFEYDAVGNVVAMNDPDGRVAHYTYDDRDALIRAEQPDGQVLTYSYDDRGDLTRAGLQPPDGSAEQVVDFAFDGLHRLRRVVTYPDWPAVEQEVVRDYTYDGQGHRSAFVSEQAT